MSPITNHHLKMDTLYDLDWRLHRCHGNEIHFRNGLAQGRVAW